MKTHSATEPGRPRRHTPDLSFLPRAAWVFAAFAALFIAGGVRAQSFLPTISQVIATEDNDAYFDHLGNTPAVIIVKNTGSVTGTISNFSLTDNPAQPRKWIIPTLAGGVSLTLPAGESLVFFASGLDRPTPPYATNFLLPCGSTAYLYSPQSSLVSQQTVYGSECEECRPLITPNTASAWIVPTANNPPSTGTDWRLPAFVDTSWSRGQPCLGYDNWVLYSVFDTGFVDTVNRTITDVTGPTLHTGTWPPPTLGPPQINIPLATFPKVIENVGFIGPNNINSYVQYSHHAELDPGAGGYTWSIWIRPAGDLTSGSEVILRKGMDSSTSNAGYVMTRTSGNNVSMQLLMPGFATVTATTAGGLVTSNVWHHILATVTRSPTANNLTLYHNGVQRAQAAITLGMNINTSLPLYLARAVSGGAIMYTGRMDDFSTWNGALAAADIARAFNIGNAGRRLDDPGVSGGSMANFGPCIQTNVQTAMKGINPGIYERLPFTIPNKSLVKSMKFKVKYADGFIAYINGVEIARRNAPTNAVWNSTATTNRPDASAIIVEEIPVPTAALSALVSGTGNILAIHAMNFTASEDRFLICPELCYDEMGPEDCYVTTSGRNFWITFPGNFPEDLPTNPLQLSLCITGSVGTTGQVTVPGLGFTQNFVLPAGGKTDISLPKAASLDKSDIIEKKGVHITASKNVAVYGKTRIDFSTDTFLAHQYETLGSSYIVLGWGNSAGYAELNGSQFGIVATADNTHVTVKPASTTGSHTAGVPYNFILNQGQTYLLRNTNNSPADLTGTEITSDSPIAVFGGHRCANITGTLIFCDTVLEQNLPVALWKTEYVTAPLATRTSSELIRVVAAENATIISINGAPQAPVLNKGEKRNFNVPAGAVISSTKKFLVAHFSRSFDVDGVVNSDPFQINAQPTASWLSGYKFCTAPASEFGAHYANIIARNAELAGVVVNPAPLAIGAITPIPATAYSYRQVTLAAGTTYTTSGRTHGLEIYSWGQYDSLGHTGGMGFDDASPPTFAQCPPDITIFATQQPAGGMAAAVPDFAAQFGITDNCCPLQSISVEQTPRPGVLLPVGDHTVTITAIDCNNNIITCIVIVHVRTDPRATAFPTQFGNPGTEATIWGWHANPDGDCYDNEQEYTLGGNMAVAENHHDAFNFRRIVFGGVEGVEVSYRKRNDDPSIDYTPEGTSDLNGWFSGLGHFEQTSAVPDSFPGFTRVRAFSHDSVPFSRFYVRLLIYRN